MATTNSKPLILFPKENSISVVLAIFISFLLLLDKASSSDSLSFNFANFGPDVRDIIFQGDAIQSSGTLQLTKLDESGRPTTFSAGRVLYSAPVHLWEKSTGRLASFFTTFTFVIKPVKDSDEEADGITFFIAPPESNLPSGSSGKFLGLVNPDTALNPSLNQVVAVEFDTYTNDEWDPNPGTTYPHLGIDVNSIKSVITAGWHIRDVPVGSVASVQISYDSVSKTLRASLSYPNSAKTMDSTLSQVVDLRGALPEWVRVGFSGTTGGRLETNNILSWSFTSSLQGTAKKKINNDVARSVI